jgi:hypothetical protein
VFLWRDALRQLPLNLFRNDSDQEHLLTAIEDGGWKRDFA